MREIGIWDIQVKHHEFNEHLMNIFSWAGRIQYGTQNRYGPHPKYFGEHIFKSVKINSSGRKNVESKNK